MDSLLLKAVKREELGKQVATLRQSGFIPAVLYGKKTDNANLMVQDVEFGKILAAAGESTLIDLQVGAAAPVKALIYDVQYGTLQHNIIHIDFYQVRMDEKITATVHVRFVGSAPAVKEQGGVLITGLAEIDIKCFPADLPHELTVDLSGLKNFSDKIVVRDLPVGDKVEVLASADTMVAMVTAPREEEVVTVEAPVEGVLPEVVGQEGKDGAEEAVPEVKEAKKE
ncbi:50S ribosomal protein L25 [Candidatus Falkowbacteria bacterium]|nr:50S ribosomal protein L25 [Candidatus Falkowbacteria bacterium]